MCSSVKFFFSWIKSVKCASGSHRTIWFFRYGWMMIVLYRMGDYFSAAACEQKYKANGTVAMAAGNNCQHPRGFGQSSFYRASWVLLLPFSQFFMVSMIGISVCYQ